MDNCGWIGGWVFPFGREVAEVASLEWSPSDPIFGSRTRVFAMYRECSASLEAYDLQQSQSPLLVVVEFDSREMIESRRQQSRAGITGTLLVNVEAAGCGRPR